MARILIVDDSAFIRGRHTEFLAGTGHEIEQAESGEDAVEISETRRPDLVVLDLVMPGMQGQELITVLRSRWPSIQLIVCSADKQHARRNELRDLGVSSFLPKPATAKMLQDAVAEVLSPSPGDDGAR